MILAGAGKPALRIMVGVSFCLAAAMPQAYEREQFGSLGPGGGEFDGERLAPPAFELYGRFAQDGSSNFASREIHADPSQPVPLPIKLPKIEDAEYKFVMITGLPDDFTMSSGFRTKNAWLVSTRDVGHLQIMPERTFVGKFTLHIVLVTEGSKTEEQTVAVDIRPRPDEEPRIVLPSGGATSVTSAISKLDPPSERRPKKTVSEEEEEAGMERAKGFLANADIAAMRLIYESLAMKGSARAAFAMARTFDPEFLIGKRIEGLKPDVDLARRWYNKAIALGSQDAKASLANLASQ